MEVKKERMTDRETERQKYSDAEMQRDAERCRETERQRQRDKLWLKCTYLVESWYEFTCS